MPRPGLLLTATPPSERQCNGGMMQWPHPWDEMVHVGTHNGYLIQKQSTQQINQNFQLVFCAVGRHNWIIDKDNPSLVPTDLHGTI